MVGQRLVKVVAQVPTHREAVGRHTHKLPLGAQALEEKNELQAEKTTGSTDGLPPRAYKGRTKSLTNERSNAASSRR